MPIAAPVPTTTGAAAAGNVRTRAATIHTRTPLDTTASTLIGENFEPRRHREHEEEKRGEENRVIFFIFSVSPYVLCVFVSSWFNVSSSPCGRRLRRG